MFKPKINDKLCLETLEEPCKKFEMDEYSIGKSSERKVCLCKREDNWEVFILERGLEFDKTKHKNCFDACIDVLKCCSYSIDEFKDASNEYINILSNKANVNKCKIKIKQKNYMLY